MIKSTNFEEFFMIITVSQILIFICVIFFILFNLIAVYLYQESYGSKNIEIKNSSIAWEILSDIDVYQEWWHKFYAIDHVKNYVTVEETHENLFFKIVVKNLSNSVIEEHWTFIIKENGDSNLLLVKKETLTKSKILNFMHKYLHNRVDIKNFTNNFIKEQGYLIQDKFH
ncbi:MAG: hypothetical protein LBH40_00555 [Alphaproteobacteria bacterium]|jgi:archaellin|nr:hypothetical protein [Alphaproteobacteria bacterium]